MGHSIRVEFRHVNFPDDLFSRIPGDGFSPLVENEDVSPHVGRDDPIDGAFNQVLKEGIGLPEFLFDPFPFRNVEIDSLVAHDRALIVSDGVGREQDGDLFSVLLFKYHLDVFDVPFPFDSIHKPAAVFEVDVDILGQIFPEEVLLVGIAQHIDEGMITLDESALLRTDEEAVPDPLEERSELLLGALQILFGPSAFGDIPEVGIGLDASPVEPRRYETNLCLLEIALAGGQGHIDAEFPAEIFSARGHFLEETLVLFANDGKKIFSEEVFPGYSDDFRGYLVGERDLTPLIEYEDPVVPHFHDLLNMPTRILMRPGVRPGRPFSVHGESCFPHPSPISTLFSDRLGGIPPEHA